MSALTAYGIMEVFDSILLDVVGATNLGDDEDDEQSDESESEEEDEADEEEEENKEEGGAGGAEAKRKKMAQGLEQMDFMTA